MKIYEFLKLKLLLECDMYVDFYSICSYIVRCAWVNVQKRRSLWSMIILAKVIVIK